MVGRAGAGRGATAPWGWWVGWSVCVCGGWGRGPGQGGVGLGQGRGGAGAGAGRGGAGGLAGGLLGAPLPFCSWRAGQLLHGAAAACTPWQCGAAAALHCPLPHPRACCRLLATAPSPAPVLPSKPRCLRRAPCCARLRGRRAPPRSGRAGRRACSSTSPPPPCAGASTKPPRRSSAAEADIVSGGRGAAASSRQEGHRRLRPEANIIS